MVDKLKNRLTLIGIMVLASFACSGNNDNAHTTATTFVSPPTRQVLHAESRPPNLNDSTVHAQPNDPLLVFNLPNGKTFREGDEVVIDFSLANAKLKGDGGEFRIRYIIDDDDMQWIDRWQQVVLTGWTPGEHRIRLELIGPDGWPYGDNIITREIAVVK